MNLHADLRTSHRSPPIRHRPRAAARHRRAGDGAVDRRPRQRSGGRDGVPDHPRLPHPQPLRDRRQPGDPRARRRDRRQRHLRRALRRREGGPGPQARPRRPARGGAGPGQERHLHRLGQGRGRQVERHRQPRRGPGRRRQEGRRARRRRLGLLAAPHARRRRGAPQGQRRAQAHPHHRSRGHLRDVDRLLRRAGRRRRLARPDAPQGAPAVPGGRRLGRARLPAHRPAARHRRRLDDAGPAAAAGQVPDRDHAAAGGPEGGAPARPRWRPSSSSRSPA